MGRGQRAECEAVAGRHQRQPLATPGINTALAHQLARRFGIDILSPPQYSSPGYETFFPSAANRGLAPLIRDAQLSDRGVIEPWSQERQLDYLSMIAVIADRDEAPEWWQRTWQAAVTQSGLGPAAPGSLDRERRRWLLGELVDRPAYPQLLTDLVAEAMRLQVSR